MLKIKVILIKCLSNVNRKIITEGDSKRIKEMS